MTSTWCVAERQTPNCQQKYFDGSSMSDAKKIKNTITDGIFLVQNS
jgi:hypothetical protein